MAIDTEAFVMSLARVICAAPDGECFCVTQGTEMCPSRMAEARAALSHLLPLIIELGAEEENIIRGVYAGLGKPIHAEGAKSVLHAIRALIPTQGADHG